MKKIIFQLTKGKVFQKAPTKVIYDNLLQKGIISKGDSYKANYDCNDGKVIIEIDDIVMNIVKTETNNFIKDKWKFKK